MVGNALHDLMAFLAGAICFLIEFRNNRQTAEGKKEKVMQA
jgi:hypothetical protein